MNAPENPRVFTPSTDGAAPKALFIGIYGPSGSGKTYSALRLATGIQAVLGGDIAVVDTEADRARHYKPPFEFTHYPFVAPYRSVDYLAALRQLVAGGARTIIVDSMSHEHSGPGGVTQTHDEIVAAKGERYTFTAWRIAKAGRKQLITAMTTEFKGCCFIFCFRAKDTTDFEAKPPRKLGWMPISDDDFLFEMTVCALLAPGSDGVPTFKSDMVGERQFLKLPMQFRSLFRDGKQLDEDTGRRLAEWARGGVADEISSPRGAPPKSVANSAAPSPQGDSAASSMTAAEYVDHWSAIVASATSADQLAKAWNDDKATRNLIEWPDDGSFATLKSKVAKAVEFLKVS
jgi:ABC-type dipeptide/oligopeptide/nickel transport system ATPase subunit